MAATDDADSDFTTSNKHQAYWGLDTTRNLSLDDIGTFLQGHPMVSDMAKCKKPKPETHLNPYEWTLMWNVMTCCVGITDYEKQRDQPGAQTRAGKRPRGAAEQGRSTSMAREKPRP